DNASRYSFRDVRKLLKESDVSVYAIGILAGGDLGSRDGVMGQAYLDDLTGLTGGKSFYPSTGIEMDEIFERIALELRHQYSIGYRPTNFNNDGKWHKLKIKVNPPRGLPRLTLRNREGYFATAKSR
ncbi:MAG: VWA domain-containing protein, partial [Pyrinomonadaceae bacterium]|nr:VWA domain-containing protein [Pyrinomonadaceae bacterium]